MQGDLFKQVVLLEEPLDKAMKSLCGHSSGVYSAFELDTYIAYGVYNNNKPEDRLKSLKLLYNFLSKELKGIKLNYSERYFQILIPRKSIPDVVTYYRMRGEI